MLKNNSAKEERKKSKQSSIKELAKKSKLQAYGIYERISKVIVDGKKTWRKNKHKIEDILDNESHFIDTEYVPNQYQLNKLQTQNSKLAKEVNWYKLHNFFKNEKYSVTGECQIRKQVMKNRGYVWIVDALNVLSVQPGLVQQLFEKKKAVREGIYPIWLNFNGKWTQLIIDDYIPIFQNFDGKNQFLFTSPHPKFNEIWYILLEKAMAKAYGGYYRLMQGIENYAVRDFTGAPYEIFDIVYVKPGKNVTNRDKKHMKDIWKKVKLWLKKGYILSICPREPTQLERVKNKRLNIPNKKYYMSKGLYSGHNYAIVTAQEVESSTGEKNRILKLRNPWLNEKWEGDWSENSPLWTQKLKEELNYNKEKGNEFWMSVKDLMGYFECISIYKTVPGNTFNNLPIKFKEKKYGRVVIRVSVPSKGKYTFSVDQKDLRSYQCPNLKYCKVKLTLGKLEESGVTLLSHTSSLKLRNTFIRKSIEKGEYYLLIERVNSDENKKWIKKDSKLMDSFNDISISSYGPKTCSLKVAESVASVDTIYNYLSYSGWKSYSTRRIGKKLSSFRVNFYDQSWNKMSLHLLNIPDSMIYAFKNPNDFGGELKSKIAGITNKELVGPEGRIGFRQDFSMNSEESDIFILRDKEEEEKDNEPINYNFQIKSVVGRKFFGDKGNHESLKNVYELLMKEKGERRLTEVEKDDFFEDKMGLFDVETGKKLEYEVKVVDEVKKKQFVIPMKKEEYEDIVNFDEVEKKEKEVQAEQRKRRKTEDERKRKERERLRREEEKVRREFELRNRTTFQNPKVNQKNNISTGEVEGEAKQVRNKIERPKDEKKLLQIGSKSIKMSRKKKCKKKSGNEGKKPLKFETERLNREDFPLDVLVLKTRDDLLYLKNSEIKILMEYYSFKGFAVIYKLDEDLTNQLREKLKDDKKGLFLIDGKAEGFQYQFHPKKGNKTKSPQIQSENKLEKKLESKKRCQTKNLKNNNFMNRKCENKNKDQSPNQKMKKIEIIGSRDDYQTSRRNKNNINSVRVLQKPLRSMSRAASPKFDRSASKKNLEKNIKVDFGSPNGRDVLKQNKQNEVTLSQRNLIEGGALSVGLNRVDSTCNLSKGHRETLDFSNKKKMRKSCDFQSKKQRNFFNIGNIFVSNPNLINEGFNSKNYRNMFQGNKSTFTTNNSLRNSTTIFESIGEDIKNCETNFIQKKEPYLNSDDDNRLERLKRKLTEKKNLKKLDLRKKEMKNLSNKSKSFISKNEEGVVKEDLNQYYQNIPRRNINHGIAKINSAIYKIPPKRNMSSNIMRNTVNLANLSKEREAKLNSKIFHNSTASKKKLETSTFFKSMHTSNVNSPMKKKYNYCEERVTTKPRMEKSLGFNRYQTVSCRQSLNPTPLKMRPNSRRLNQMISPHKIRNTLQKSFYLNSDTKILGEKKKEIKTLEFSSQFKKNSLNIKRSAVFLNQPIPVNQNRHKRQQMSEGQQIFEERIRNLNSFNNGQNPKVTEVPFLKINQPTVPNPRNRKSNFRNFASPQKQCNNRNFESLNYFNSGNVNHYCSPNRMQRNYQRGRGNNFMHAKINSSSKKRNIMELGSRSRAKIR